MVDQLINDFYGAIKAEHIRDVISVLRHHLPKLVFDDIYNRQVREALVYTPLDKLFSPERIRNENNARAFVSGLLIWNDSEEDAHAIAQSIPTSEGSYFHAIIHRREPDIWNSGYWFRKTGDHPVYELIYDFVAQNRGKDATEKLLAGNSWDPDTFNTIVEQAQRAGSIDDTVLREIQLAELLFLLAHTYRHSIGS